MISLSGAANAVLEEVGRKLGTLLLVVVGIRAILVRIALRRLLELHGRVRARAWHGRVHIAGVRLGLARCAGSARSLGGRRAAGRIGRAQVLLGELVGQARVGVVGSRGARAALIFGAGLLALRGLGGILRWILVLREVSRGCVAGRVGLALLAYRCAALALTRRDVRLARRREDGLGERGGCGGIGTTVVGRACVGKIEVQAIALVIHNVESWAPSRAPRFSKRGFDGLWLCLRPRSKSQLTPLSKRTVLAVENRKKDRTEREKEEKEMRGDTAIRQLGGVAIGEGGRSVDKQIDWPGRVVEGQREGWDGEGCCRSGCFCGRDWLWGGVGLLASS